MIQQNNKNDSKNKFFKNPLLTFSIKNYEKKMNPVSN